MKRPRDLRVYALARDGLLVGMAVFCRAHAAELMRGADRALVHGERLVRVRHPALLAALAEDERTGSIACVVCAAGAGRAQLEAIAGVAVPAAAVETAGRCVTGTGAAR